jgi:hypothetical protein
MCSWVVKSFQAVTNHYHGDVETRADSCSKREGSAFVVKSF